MNRCSLVLICAVIVVSVVGSAPGITLPVFSLDDNPAVPVTSPPGWIPGFGAEDPFGLGLVPPPGFAPSPTLGAIPAMDADILTPIGAAPWPMVNVGMSPLWNGRIGYVNAVADDANVKPRKAKTVLLGFSVDRVTVGQAGTAVDWQANLNQQPGDIFRTTSSFLHPINFVGLGCPVPGYAGLLPSAGIGGGNMLFFDESQLLLTAGNGVGMQVGPNVMCPPVDIFTHDNVDAVNWQTLDKSGDFVTDKWQYFSVAPDERVVSGFGPADIYVTPPGVPSGRIIYVCRRQSDGPVRLCVGVRGRHRRSGRLGRARCGGWHGYCRPHD
ncbi:MAG: hypothetical protein HQ546_05225 [Planctomycetes bacterium]|nr:hypothetical protein [Planctomycetota bacterium]